MVVNREAKMHIETESIQQYINMTSKVTCHVNGNSFTADFLKNHHVPMPSLSPLQDAATPEDHSSPDDEELTSLTWLQDNNLLRNLRVGTCGGENEETTPTESDCTEDGPESPDDVGCKSRNGPVFHLSHVPYNPLVHVSAKPPYSFSCLIFMAIEDAPSKALPVKEIYSWIIGHFPYFQKAPTGWKNSVRHNLSLNKCFRKVDKDKGQTIGKGSLWSIDPEFRPNLLQAVKKIPYCPFSQLEDSSRDVKMESDNEDGNSNSNVNVPSPDLFPFLSKKLSVSAVKAYEVDAAATMLELKNATSNNGENDEKPIASHFIRKMKRKKLMRFRPTAPKPRVTQPEEVHADASPVVTNNPSEDHTYSSAAMGGQTEDQQDEDLTLAEGAKALLSLARFAKSRRKIMSRLEKRVSVPSKR